MQEGRILAASHDGAYVIRFVGDVRLTLCTTIDDYFQHMFEDPEFTSVWVDLCEAEGIDSTTLGLLAKLALKVKENYGFRTGDLLLRARHQPAAEEHGLRQPVPAARDGL